MGGHPREAELGALETGRIPVGTRNPSCLRAMDVRCQTRGDCALVHSYLTQIGSFLSLFTSCR